VDVITVPPPKPLPFVRQNVVLRDLGESLMLAIAGEFFKAEHTNTACRSTGPKGLRPRNASRAGVRWAAPSTARFVGDVRERVQVAI